MPNALQGTARQSFAKAEIDWLNDDIKAVLLGSSYTYAAAHQFHSDLSDIIATSANLTGKSVDANGVVDADPGVFSSVAAGPPGTQVFVFQDTGVSGTSRLIAYWDSDASSVLLSVSPDGGNIRAIWSDGSLKMFRL